MKKFAIVGILVFAMAGFAFGLETGTTTVTASFTQSLVVEAPGNATVTLAANTTPSIGSAKFYSNVRLWKIGFSSLNGGNLKYTDAGATVQLIPYSLVVTATSPVGAHTVASGTLPVTGTSTDWLTVTGRTAGTALVPTLTVPLSIGLGAEDTATWTGGASYTDTITITIAAQ